MTAWTHEPAGGTYWFCTYQALGLQRTYWIYEPAGYPTARTDAWPLVVVLHGCTQQGPDVAHISQFDWEAAQQHFLVVYPNQAAFTNSGTSIDGNGSQCWNWFLPPGQSRGAGEPALIAGLTLNVIGALNVDRSRVDVLGVSAGAATADIMAATYPEIYAAAGIVAGCEYKGLPCLASASAVPPQVSGQEGYQASADSTGPHARVVPFIVENGDTDTVVPVANAFEVVQQMQITNDYAEHAGTLQNTVPSQYCTDKQVVPNPPADTSQTPPVVYSAYDVFTYTLDGSACPTGGSTAGVPLGQLWIVHGELHAWPGGPNLSANPSDYGSQQGYARIYTNPGGPNFTDAAYQFFAANPCTVSDGACVQAAPAADTPEAPLTAPILIVGLGAALVGWRRSRRRAMR